MIQEIQYDGYTAQPSDDLCPDGALDYAVNLYNENGSMHPVQKPHNIGEIPQGWRVVYVHANSTYRHLILFEEATGALTWIDFPVGDENVNRDFEGHGNPNITLIQGKQINKVVGIGNTLVVLTPSDTHYILWRSETEGYVYLGDHLPNVDLSFGLSVNYDSFSIPGHENIGRYRGAYIGQVEYNDAASGDDKSKIIHDNTNAVMGGINAVRAKCREEGYFLNNFFVRYALKMYDGNIIMHSAPILMIAASDRSNPLVALNKDSFNPSDRQYTAIFSVESARFNLQYKLLSNKSSLDDWGDIIKAVDVFVTPEIDSYNASGTFDKMMPIYQFNLNEYTNSDGNFRPGSDYNVDSIYADEMYYIANDYAIVGDVTAKYASKRYYYRDRFTDTNLINTNDAGSKYVWIFDTPKFSDARLAEMYQNLQFYRLKSIDIKSLSTEMTTIPTSDGILSALEQPDRLMPDDYFSHDKIVAKTAYTYNSRINLSNIKRQCFSGYNPLASNPYCDTNDSNTQISYTAYVYIRENGQDVVVKQFGSLWYLSPYFFYPNPYAYKAVIGVGSKYYEVELKPHDFLHGAYYFGKFVEQGESPKFFPDYLTPLSNFTPPTSDQLQAKWIEYTNQIYTSEVNNPFLFKAEGVNSISTAEILTLSSVTKALSQGQFGQFPMYAFTTDGVWALETSTTGGIASLHPVTRDVCTNIDSITQIDNAVLFHTARGIMLLQGSETICISDVLDSQAPLNITSLPHFANIPSQFTALVQPRTPFAQFLANSAMLYDYTHQRIILYQKSNDNVAEVSYIYSLKSKTWAMMQTSIKYVLNAYPSALAISHDNQLVNYSYEDGGTKPPMSPQLLVSRPLKLGAPNYLKTVTALIQRGSNIRYGSVKTILYGSRDLHSWHLVGSSIDHYLRGYRGSPYKYFRIVSLCELLPGESLTGASVELVVRQNNQLR